MEVVLELLQGDLTFGNQYSYTFISDKQKGLLPAMEEVLPNANHRFCLRHMYNNFKEEFKGLALKQLLWRTARATKMQDFHNAMEGMKTVDEGTYNWLCKRPAINWIRSHFSTLYKSDMLLNNISECFNSIIFEAKDKPIITLLEKIRIILMERIHSQRDKMRKHNEIICTKIKKIIEEMMVKSAGWIFRWNGGDKFEVVGQYGEQLMINLSEKSRGCRKWDLCGIPCEHAVATLNYLGEDPIEYVHQYYFKETFLKTYENLLNLVNGKKLWPQTNYTPIVPPSYSRQPGRPKKCRRRESDEPLPPNSTRLGKKGTQMKCTIYNLTGHNKRGCPIKKSKTNASVSGTSATHASQSSQLRKRLSQQSQMGKGLSQPSRISKGISNHHK